MKELSDEERAQAKQVGHAQIVIPAFAGMTNNLSVY